MADKNSAVQTDELRIKYGFWVVIIGLIVVAVVSLIAILKWTTAADVTAVVGSVTGVVGTVVGAFFGVQVGSAGKEKTESERKVAQDKVEALASALHPDIAANILARFGKVS